MPTYAYKAKNDSGAIVNGTVVADTEQAAVSTLDRMQLFPLSLETRSERVAEAPQAPAATSPATLPDGIPAAAKTDRAASRQAGFSFRRRIRIADTALFSRQLADLLKAGVNLNRALGTLTRQTSNPAFSAVIDQVRVDVAGGMPLADALAKHPAAFSPLYVSLVRAGEAGGFLEDVLHRAAIFAEKELELRGRIVSSLIYPILLVSVASLAILYFVFIFIPNFTTIFKDLGGDLPLLTKIMIGISDTGLRFWWAFAGGAAAVGGLLWRTLRTAQGRYVFDRIKLRLPLLGDLIKKTAIARFTRTLGTLLKSGVPILTAIEISREALSNEVLKLDATEAAAAVKEGRSLAEPLGKSPHFPPVVVDMIAVGEESGSLDEVLGHVADAYEREVDRAVRVFVSLLEPALLIVMATIVGLIVVSMLLPIYSLQGAMK
jgi:type II secretion system protein F